MTTICIAFYESYLSTYPKVSSGKPNKGNPNWLWIQWGLWIQIRIQEGGRDTQDRKKIKNFYALKFESLFVVLTRIRIWSEFI
jgi:hypothetical protein